MKPTLYWGCHFALGLIAVSAHAATWTVTTTASGGTCTAGSTTDANCTLDAAITAAGNGDTILFAPAVQTQTIFFGTQAVRTNVTIDASPKGVVLDGSNAHYFFDIFSSPAVVFSHLTFQHGLGAPAAGALYIESGDVTIDSCTFAHNAASEGGAIFLNGASLTILNSTFTDNNASFGGGAISAAGVSSLVIANSTITGNSAANEGGGIDALVANVFLLSDIIAANSTSGSGPDISSYSGGAVTSLGSNIIGDNTGDSLYIGDPTDQLGSDASPVDPQFSAAGLAGNGGATQTIALQASSPALRTGNCAGHVGDAASPTIPAAVMDQRDFLRGTPCSVGAYDATIIFYGGFEN